MIIFLLIYVLANYYVGVRGYKAFNKVIPFISARLFWILFWITAFSYIISMLGRNFIPSYIRNPFTIIGVFWMAALFYLILLLPIVDLLRYLFHKTPYSSTGFGNSLSLLYSNGLTVFIIIAVLLVYGIYNASHPIVNTYDITLSKKNSQLSQLKAVMVSDIHLDSGVSRKKLLEMVEKINSLNPDIVFLCGDIIDENTSQTSREFLPSALRDLKADYGVYAVSGNHDYYSVGNEKMKDYFKKANVTLLTDEAVSISNKFYILGRNDIATERSSNAKRLTIENILSQPHDPLPVILLDHQPISVDEAKAAEVDLQLSGHTHQGQFFPNNFITKKTFVSDFGHYTDGNYNMIVSSGYGTWGPPIRIGTKSEIVEINISFH